jgi:hypothetical protein
MSAKIKGALIAAMIFGSASVAPPIGHRQPGAAELPDNFTLPPSDLELEALDKALDKKLTICRGC